MRAPNRQRSSRKIDAVDPRQLSLFDLDVAPGRAAASSAGNATATWPDGCTPLDFSAALALAARLPEELRLGTSSWTFPGWAGTVYPGSPSLAELRERGLAAYTRHPLLRTVGVDRSYYEPLTLEQAQALRAQLPDGFRCVVKCWSAITSAVEPTSRAPNPRFLDVTTFRERVLDPLRSGLGDGLGPVVFELMPLRRSEVGRVSELLARLDAFLAELPRGPSYAVELRNRELFSPAYARMLARHGVSHVFNYWERMPPIGEQLRLRGLAEVGDALVCRALLPPGQRYDERREAFAPFDRLLDPQPALLTDVALLTREAERLGKVAFVIINNKAEGSAPLTVRRIAEHVAGAAP